MAKYTVVKRYKDRDFDPDLKKNDEVEMTVKRADEVEKTLSDNGFDGPFLERTDKK